MKHSPISKVGTALGGIRANNTDTESVKILIQNIQKLLSSKKSPHNTVAMDRGSQGTSHLQDV